MQSHGQKLMRCIATGVVSLTAVSVPLLAGGDIAAAATVPCSGVSVTPGANVQAAFDAYGTGTTFCFQPGTYVLTAPVTPKSYDQLISVVTRGAVFTGNGVHNAGYRGAAGPTGQRDVLVSGFVFSGFANVTGSSQSAALVTGDNWKIINNEIANNAQTGITLANGNVVRANFIHHNGRYGFSAGPNTNMLIENNEVSFNNTVGYATGAGGARILRSSYVTIRANNVHDNYGNGLHTDTDNYKITYENNTVTNNWGIGIFHQSSADAVIRNNTLTGNDKKIAGLSLYNGADLFLDDSKNTEIYGNTINAGVHGIGLYDNVRGSGAYGLYEIRNVNVHDNTITLPAGGMTGMVGGQRPANYTTGNNKFVHNTYYVTNVSAGSWQWNATKTWSQWKTHGNDTTGSLGTWTPAATTTTTTAPATTTTAPATTTTAPATTTTAPATTTTTAPATTTTTTAPPVLCSGVSVAPGANVQSTFNAYGTGTTFCFQPGTYVLTAPVTPKTNARLISVVPRGAVFTGNNVYNAGMRGYGGAAGQRNVLLSGFVFKNFANVMGTTQTAAVMTGDNWTVTNNEITSNAQIGLTIANGNVVQGNFIHHNGRYGFAGGPNTNVLFENNEVSFNNTAQYPIGNAGGSKIIKSSFVTFRGNNVHDNYGNGLHTDTDNINITYENNTVTNNWGVGIFHENSSTAVIRNNILSGNDKRIAGSSLFSGADIYLNDAKNVEIHGNVIYAGVHGIGMVDNERGSGPYGLYEVRNVYVHDNTITLPAGGTSGMVGGQRPAIYTTGNNRFVNNDYHVTNAATGSWQWNGAKTWSQWNALTHDVTGSVNP